MIYFIADLHIGHQNVLRLNNRPFRNLDEMHECIISNWNSKVKPDDEVYILGDVAYRCNIDIVKFLNHLNGTKYLIVGNHDRRNLKNPDFRKCFKEICDMKTISVDGNSVVLCHYPLGEWDGYYRGAYHIHGHIHNNTSIKVYNYLRDEDRALNAGVDIISYTPATLNELISYNKSFKLLH